ncbi:hypothetical protein FI667_g6751, partial [Globisporangium splendens]
MTVTIKTTSVTTTTTTRSSSGKESSSLLHGKTLGGAWHNIESVSDATYVRFLNARLPNTKENRERVRTSKRRGGDLKLPTHYNAEDWFAMFISLFIVPVGIAMYFVLWALTLPGFIIASLYLASFPKPLRIIERTKGYYLYSVFQFLLAIPALLVTFVYWVYLFVLIMPTTLLFSILTWRIANVSTNWATLKSMRQSTGFTWNDILVSLMGAMYRQGLGEFVFYFPAVVVIVPVLKYLFTCNPFLHRLSPKYINQWTVPLGLTDDQAVASAVQSISWTAHVEKDRADIDNDRFAAHYPLTPVGRAEPAAVGVQFTNSIVNFTKTTHNISGTGLRSESGKRGIYVVELFFWNPCHMVTGYVEVNVQFEGSIEHPMWCFTGDNYWGNRFYKNVDNLFWNYAPEAGEYFSGHGDAPVSR